ncbi:MAG TPA: YncE family protein [Terracidiphilus sp.]|nr:YncE family protein [Terracidiphilus sp.]
MSLFSNVLSQACPRLVQAGAVLAVAAFFAGCGNSYRPVITPINPTGPASQPIAFAVVVSSPGANVPGIATVLDYSGDSILTQAPIGPNPFAFTLDANGANGYTANSDHTLTNFQVSNTQPQEKNIFFSTLPTAAQTVGLFSPTAGLWSPDLNGNVVDVLAINGTAEAFKLAVPVAGTPVAVVGLGSLGQHIYSISQNVPFDVTCNNAPASVGQNGEADALEVTSFTVSARIPLGKCPVYGVSSSDGRRVFVLNRGSDTVTVINSQNNTLDQCTPFTNQNGQIVTCHPSLPLSTAAGLAGTNVPAVAGPVYAEYIPTTQQLVIANYDGGTISLIDVSLDEFGNDSQTFGTTFTIPVGHDPASVTVLADGSRAYTADQADGTVHVVNLTSHTVEKTLTVTGHPRTVVSTSNSLFGKVYVASPDTTFLTIIRTDQDIVDTTVLIEGNIIDVRVSSQTTSKGNANISSRVPGGGQPCYQPGPTASLAVCQNIHP